jgi:hypothetical protein
MLGSTEEVARKLVWLPTWYQTRLLCRGLGVTDAEIHERLHTIDELGPEQELLEMYQVLLEHLQGTSNRQKRQPDTPTDNQPEAP